MTDILLCIWEPVAIAPNFGC